MPTVEFIIVSVIIEIIIYIFHASMLILLITKRKTSFKSPFYNIFRILLIVDLAIFINILLSTKIPLLFVEFFKSHDFLASLTFNFATYLAVFQYFGHLFMAFNRFTVFWFPLKHDRIWRKNWYIYLLIGLPFLNICYRLHEPCEYVFGNDNTVVAFIINKDLHARSYLINTIIYIFTTVFGALFNILSLIKYKSENHSTNSNEKSLFFVTCLIFIVQVFRLCYSLGRSLFASNKELTAFLMASIPFIADIFAWIGSISLLLLSKTTRKEYINFYKCKKPFQVHSTSSHPAIITIKY